MVRRILLELFEVADLHKRAVSLVGYVSLAVSYASLFVSTPSSDHRETGATLHEHRAQ